MQRYSQAVLINQNARLTVAAGASVYVYQAGTSTLATLYEDNETTTKANPITASAEGEYSFKAANGTYDIVAISGSSQDRTDGVVLFDPDDAIGISIKNFGAKGDGTTDDSAAIQAALDAANAAGGGIVIIPPGRYRKADTSATLIVYSNTTIRGYGDASIIFHDDRDTNPRKDLFDCGNTNNIAFESFKIEGTALTYTNETNQSQTLSGNTIDGLRVVGMTFEKLRYMATSFSDVKRAQFIGNRFDYIVRDGIRCTNSDDVVVSGNILRRVADDAIALHSLDASTTPGAGFVVTGNVLEACQGIKVLGAKMLTIRGNVIRRSLRNPILVQLMSTGTEGATPQFAIDISGNNIADTFGTRGTNYCIRVVSSLARAKGGLSTQPGVNATPYAYNWLDDIDSGSPVRVGQFAIRVCENVITRTRAAAAAYSNWGYGSLFDRTTTNFISDPAIVDGDFAVHGINVVAPAFGLQINGNNISGCGDGFAAILLEVTGTSNIQDFTAAQIANNVVFDCPGSGVSLAATGSGSGAKQVVIQNNTFDLDPFFRDSTHNSDNTWSSTGNVVGISLSGTSGILVGGNVFKNMDSTGLSSTTATESHPNIVYADFAGQGNNASNKGVRSLPQAAMNIIVPIDGDPTSSTYGQISNAVTTRLNSLPSTGKYIAGHVVRKDLPTVAGSASSQYVVTGWVRLTTGSNHVLDTDWVEMRTLTGT